MSFRLVIETYRFSLRMVAPTSVVVIDAIRDRFTGSFNITTPMIVVKAPDVFSPHTGGKFRGTR
jgi:hypothetical protein